MDDAQIRSLLAQERYCRDTAQWQRMRDTYHPDDSKTHISIQWYNGGVEGWIERTKKVVSETINTVHLIIPGFVDIRGSKALSESFCQVTSRFEHKGYEFDKISTIRLVSRLEKLRPSEGHCWKILSLEAIYIRDSIVPAAPLPPDAVPVFDGVEKHRSSYRYSAWLLNTINITSSEKQPGEDNRASVKEIFDQNRAWLTAN